MQIIDVFEWDFVLNEKISHKYGCNDFAEAKAKAYDLAKGFCEGEKPVFSKEAKNIWTYRTGCDYGTVIIVKED